ncbi:MAG TPA: ABC transporter ATP-binding protein [Candidatus Baltobacteraceae bacterium]|nr:ABC transporter ATP-binding protein [Candidatus Baltobacteraceae bacterium]
METTPAVMQECLLSMRGIRKAFPGVQAVDGVDLDLFSHEIHALVGENGAGKSTLANIAFGAMRPDEGTVDAGGNRVGLVHQHFQLVGRLTVWQNVLLGREPRRGWSIDARAARARVVELAQRNGLEIDPDAFVDELPIGVQQRVELLRELEREPAVLLLDEPTAALAPAEIDSFFKTIEALAQGGTAILIVTHKLQEVIAYSKRVSVMRHGRISGRFETQQTSVDEIARAMVGGDLPQVAQREAVPQRPCFHLENVTAGSGSTAIAGVSFDVRGGEIVGVAGVEGNGQTTLADAIAGMRAYDGAISFAHAGMRTGIIPQDRHREGLVLGWSIVQNTVLGRQHLPGVRRGIAIDRRAAREDAQSIVTSLDVRAASLDVAVNTLSGGNQQKIVVGRALLGNPQFVLAYQPTRGIDVGAAALVQSRLIQARNAGAAILLISFELDEILALADRVLVMYRGRIAGSFAGAEIDRARIGRLMAGSAA